ncbi:hypothetical protein CRG98_038026 [Punica granatum]|uniref:Reverse transcriptase Ty1/copia-type domain-containing protein n=1 Tax=Punica granatum TaxID=22663 RepID=A0A2I0IC69_PUNGR|nr:hypothetical protein CRG98_038026 [Punica granatum]
MEEEFQALIHNHTWDMVLAPPSKNIIGCKWVYKIKQKTDGTIDMYKARLVAKDSSLFILRGRTYTILILMYVTTLFSQSSMLDCKPINSPVAAGACLSLHDGDPLEDLSVYQSIVGSIQYLTLSRPDIAFAINQIGLAILMIVVLSAVLLFFLVPIRYLLIPLGGHIFSSPPTGLVTFLLGDVIGASVHRFVSSS